MNLGLPAGKFLYGFFLYFGIGIAKDMNQGMKLMKFVGKNSDIYWARYLGNCLKTGDNGFPINLKRSY